MQALVAKKRIDVIHFDCSTQGISWLLVDLGIISVHGVFTGRCDRVYSLCLSLASLMALGSGEQKSASQFRHVNIGLH